MLSYPGILASFVLVSVVLYGLHRKRRSGIPLPPGPPKHPLFGNLADIPKNFVYLTYEKWGKQYNSDIIHVQAGCTSIVVLNSFEANAALFEKKSGIYSSRAQFTMMPELMGWKWLLSALPYCERWKHGRSLFQKHFHPSKEEMHLPRQLAFVRGYLLPHLLEGPDTIRQVVRHMVGGMALSVAYGIKVRPDNDPFIRMAEDALTGIQEASIPGKFLVDTIPILKYVPAWFPGAGFQRKAKIWRKYQEDFREKPFEAAVEAFNRGNVRPSFTKACLEELRADAPNHDYQLEIIKDTAAVVFAAGADTLAAAVETFFLAMLCHPHVQRKAQEDLDRVIGGNRFPHITDKADLPYITALVKETLRWQPCTPIAVPHFASEEDIYKGYRIPKGSIVIGNAWAMLHDENEYSDPMEFKPERFLKADGTLDESVRDPATVAFGFARRMCPGKDIGLSILWLIAASVLAAFNLEPKADEDGVAKIPPVEYLTGLIRHPAPFKLKLQIRTKEMEALIRNAEEQDQL